MRNFFWGRAVVFVIILIILGIGFVFSSFLRKETPVPEEVKVDLGPTRSVLGKSVQGREIESYRYGVPYGKGKAHLVFVGGIHGGYEWNSTVLAYEIMDYLKANPTSIPANLTVTVIPSLNPDGIYKVVGREGRFTSLSFAKSVDTRPGRFNANEVDLNRNFDCKWQPKSIWQSKIVSAGKNVFSEPEAVALRNFVNFTEPTVVVFWHSQSGAVYASQCEDGILPETLTVMNLFAEASGYKAIPTFDAYVTTGDAEAWLAKIGIPAITVELTTHESIEFEKNLAGVKALFDHYSR